MDNGAVGSPGLFSIDLITVKPDRVVAEVLLSSTCPRYTSPVLIESIRERFPNLPEHTCKNAEGNTFAFVMDHTSLPHLFEHLVIDLQTQNAVDEGKTFVGTTEWIDKGAGRARVEVNFTDDLSVLRAFRDAAHILNNALLE